MNSVDIVKLLRVINYLNLDGPFSDNELTDANLSILKGMQRFLNTYDHEIKHHYTFIIKYDGDIYSFLAYRVVKNAALASGKELDFRVLGELNTPEEKEYFKGINPISYKKAKKHKKAVLITGFNPICNVDCAKGLSKFFIEIFNPIEHMIPDSLKVAQDFYLKEDSPLYRKDLGGETLTQRSWDIFFTYPLGERIDDENGFYYPINFDKIFEECDKNIPIAFFELSGTEEDFGIYDFIVNSSKEGNIHIYVLPDNIINEVKDFIITNISPYVDFRNAPNLLNIIPASQIVKMADAALSYEVFNYKDYIRAKEESTDENSNS